MHEAFTAFIKHGKVLAEAKGLSWDFPTDAGGASKSGWNLTELVGGTPTPSHYLRDLGYDDKTLVGLNALKIENGLPTLLKKPLSIAWCDLIKAATCDQLFFRRNTTSHVIQNIIRPMKVMATCAGSLEPWQLNTDTVRVAVDIARKMQPSGVLADQIIGGVKNIIDTNHLAEACPLYPTLSINRLPVSNNQKSRITKSKEQLLDDLEQRKRAVRLPEKRAFWELIRILFMEQPKSYTDAVRFAALKVMVFCGLRIGEAVLLPADWKRSREYYDRSGRPAGELGGYSKALMLRHFAEKQQSRNEDSMVLFETAQYIPQIFQEILTETLDQALSITSPLRNTLRLQVETGRLLPWYAREDLVPVSELYSRVTGNLFWLALPKDVSDGFITKYRQGFNPEVLDELHQFQINQYLSPNGVKKLDMAMYQYFNRMVNSKSQHAHLLKLRDIYGSEYTSDRKAWHEVFLRVGELEDYITISTPTKVSDIKPLKLGTGNLQPWELLFLTPKRALAEERNDGITDISRYFSVGIPDPGFIGLILGEDKEKRESIFMRYGSTDEDRQLTLKSHALRHLQNTELFRLGVADTIITKRFNRRSVAQSYEYDHRSLAEEMDSVELPIEVEALLGEKASTVARMIQAGKATGPLVEKFKEIQRKEGDEVAFEFLKAEADGFHATPYGHCINSFTVDPCPKNLECFTGCRHLTATNLPENRRHLEILERRFDVALSEAQSRPSGSIGLTNQIAHATIRLENVRKLLATPAGERVFPDGQDFSKQDKRRNVLDDRYNS
jgi:hypothetical protein